MKTLRDGDLKLRQPLRYVVNCLCHRLTDDDGNT